MPALVISTLIGPLHTFPCQCSFNQQFFGNQRNTDILNFKTINFEDTLQMKQRCII